MLVILPLSLLIPRAPSKEKTFRSGNPQPLREQEEEEHREEAADCEEALLESRAVKAQETEGVVANMSMFRACVCFCVYMRACLSCEEKSASLSIRFFLQAKRGKKYALASVVNT
jgi:hypothetical protein